MLSSGLVGVGWIGGWDAGWVGGGGSVGVVAGVGI